MTCGPAREDLAVGGDLHLDAGIGLPTVPMRKSSNVFTAITGDVSVRP